MIATSFKHQLSSITIQHIFQTLAASWKVPLPPLAKSQTEGQYSPQQLIQFLSERCKTKVLTNVQVLDPSRHASHQLAIIFTQDSSKVWMLLRAEPQLVHLVQFNLENSSSELRTLTPSEFIALTGEHSLITQLRPPRLKVTETFGWTWIANHFYNHKSVIRDIVILSLILQILGMLLPLASQNIIDKVISNQAVNSLIVLGSGIGLMTLFSVGFGWLRQKLMLRLASVLDARMSEALISKLFKLPLKYFESRPTGTMVNRIHLISQLREFVSSTFLLIVLDMPFLILSGIIMFTYSWKLSLIVLSVVMLMAISSLVMGPFMQKASISQFTTSAALQSFLTEHLMAADTVKSIQLESKVQAHYAELNQQVISTAIQAQDLNNLYQSLMHALDQMLSLSILCIGAYFVMTGNEMTVGMLVAFQMFSQRVMQPMLKLTETWQSLQQARMSVQQLGDIMVQPIENYCVSPSTIRENKPLSIQFQKVSYAYNNQHSPIISEYSFNAQPGTLTLITGPSGSGKSTLLKLLAGLYPLTSGNIFVNNQAITDIPVNELRQLIGYVPQETILFTGTVYENITAGNNYSLADVIKVCKALHIHEFIEKLPMGYQTPIGEKGSGLSGGQRQRIGIARTLIKQPPVLLFDEPTSSLDEQSANQLATVLNSIKGRVTIIMVTHKIPATLKYDFLCEIKNNKHT